MPKEKGKDMSSLAAPASVVVMVPADARLTVNGQATSATSGQRRFITPALQPGKEFYYEFKAEVFRAGKMRSQAQRVLVKAGQETQVTLDLADFQPPIRLADFGNTHQAVAAGPR